MGTMDMEQFVNTTHAGANTINDKEYFATLDDDDDDDVEFTDDITPGMLTDETIEEMRGWLADCTLPAGIDAGQLDACEIISMVAIGYDGSIAQFLADGN
jgi:hypothetical protein